MWFFRIKTQTLTWCISEGQSIDDSFSLHSKEKPTPIWTPTASLTRTKTNTQLLQYRINTEFNNIVQINSKLGDKTSPGSVLSYMANAHRSTSWSPIP